MPPHGLLRQPDAAAEGTAELEDKSVETSQTETREKDHENMTKRKQNLQEGRDRITGCDTCVMGVPEAEDSVAEEIFEATMSRNVSQ